MPKYNFKVYRGDNTKGELVDYNVDVDEGMVVLDQRASSSFLHDTHE
jgi:succinate dehydrogenase/fumarate reductase-like Fe-S protein